jgi:DNA-binding XRE family transcriptional regulator
MFIFPIDNYKQSVYSCKVIVLITATATHVSRRKGGDKLNREEIGKRLRTLRGSRSLDEVAKALNVTPMAVSLWERGERVPSDDLKIKIAAYYKRSVTFIFFADRVNKTLTEAKK